MLMTLPITLLMLGLKLGLLYGIQFEGLVKFSDIGLVITGGIFLIGFMLAGVMADYKESEKLPGEIACALETLDDTLVLAHGYKPNFDLTDLRGRLRGVTESILNYFAHRVNEDDVFKKISEITDIAQVMEKAAIGAICARMSGEQHNLRKLFSRVVVIKRTNFLSTGYALMEVLSVVIFGLLLISKFENTFVASIIVCFITSIFIYMIMLIRDIDQPFEYQETGKARAADVDLFPIQEFYRRSLERIK
jgi:hypothetical protein